MPICGIQQARYAICKGAIFGVIAHEVESHASQNDPGVPDEIWDEEKDILGVCLSSREIHCDLRVHDVNGPPSTCRCRFLRHIAGPLGVLCRLALVEHSVRREATAEIANAARTTTEVDDVAEGFLNPMPTRHLPTDMTEHLCVTHSLATLNSFLLQARHVHNGMSYCKYIKWNVRETSRG